MVSPPPLTSLHSQKTGVVFRKIMDYLDYPSLLAMGKVNHELNRTALTRIIGPTVIDGISSRSELTIDRREPVELIPALCAARWLPLSIKSIGYFAARDDVQDFVNDMFGLALFLSRLPYRSLEALRLEISVNTSVESLRRCEEKHRSPVTTVTWARALSNVVDVALLVGCHKISIISDYLPDLPWAEPFPPSLPLSRPASPSSPPRNDILRLLQSAMTRISHNQIPSDTALRVKSIDLATAHLFTGTFLSYTISLFGRVASTLQELILSSSPDCYSSDSAWAALFQSIRLPCLQSLYLSFPNGAKIIPRDLFQFLSEHSSITTLKLDLCFAGISPDSALATYEDPLGRSLLPNLQVLETWPQLVPWLFPRIRRSSFTQRLVGASTPSRLASIRVLTTDFALKAKSGIFLNKAILALNPLIPQPSSAYYAQNHYPSLIVTLQMNFEETFWLEWIWTNVNATAYTTNPLLTLSELSKLTLDIDSSVKSSSDAQVDIPLIVEWLALFPKLMELEILGNPFVEDALNEDLCDAIARRCPNLRRLCCEGVIVSL